MNIGRQDDEALQDARTQSSETKTSPEIEAAEVLRELLGAFNAGANDRLALTGEEDGDLFAIMEAARTFTGACGTDVAAASIVLGVGEYVRVNRDTRERTNFAGVTVEYLAIQNESVRSALFAEGDAIRNALDAYITTRSQQLNLKGNQAA